MRFIPFVLAALVATAHAADLQPGQASGTYTADGKTTELKFATSYIEQGDEVKLLVVILSGEKVPATGWKRPSDFMKYRMKNPSPGVAFWLDENRKVVRAAYFTADGFPLGDANLFEVTLDPSGAVKGTVHSTKAAAALKKPVKLDAEFMAELPPPPPSSGL